MLKIGSDQWVELVLAGAVELGVAMEDQQARLFARHAQLLLEWNRRLNLTAIVEPTQVAVKHVLDAIAPLNHIPRHGRLLDIGTGGGFPGIPLKIMRPDQPMLLIDAVRKKINFVKHVIRELALESVEAQQVRAESLAREPGGPRFDVIVCRALSSLEQVKQWALPLLAPDGRIIAYRGPEETGANEADGVFTTDCIAYRLPVLGDPRTVTILKAAS